MPDTNEIIGQVCQMKPAFIKKCNVYRRPEGYFVFGVLNTVYGGIATPPALRLPSASGAVELGRNVLNVLSGLPTEVSDIDLAASGKSYDDHLKELGFSKPGRFAINASLVGVYFNQQSYEIISHDVNARGAFVPTAKVLLPLNTQEEQLGKVILEAF